MKPLDIPAMPSSAKNMSSPGKTEQTEMPQDTLQ
ncbi:MAG: hypothetical protein ACJAY7_000016 [Pseudohongiellaceae bacterium]|jgi:hypothetical protein